MNECFIDACLSSRQAASAGTSQIAISLNLPRDFSRTRHKPPRTGSLLDLSDATVVHIVRPQLAFRLLPLPMLVAHLLAFWAGWSGLRSNDCFCAGFRTPASRNLPRAQAVGVRKAPRHEIACWEGQRRRGHYGDFATGSDFGVAHSVISERCVLAGQVRRELRGTGGGGRFAR